ncbi:MAG: alcohol dehydrogenase catalytic domain-containing protein [Candidatus Bathyarchaeia archaeon]
MSLPDKMYAVRIWGPEDFRYERVDVPKAGKEEVIVKVGKCGVCAADPKIFHGKAYFKTRIPIVAGHEFVGEVVELGEGAGEKFDLDIGDKAIAEQIVPCWECYYCKRGLYNLCIPHHIFGVLGPDGGWAEYMKYPAKSIIWKVPKDMPWEVAVGIEPCACAIHGVERANISLNDTVVIMGAGAIGLYMLQAAKLKHPKNLISIEVDEGRRRIARELGADMALNPQTDDVKKEIDHLTDGIGADVVLEATGSPRAVEMAVDVLRKRGRFVVFGVFADKASIDWSIISDIKELEIVGGHLGLHTYPLAIKYLHEGLIRNDKINTHDFPLREFKKAMEYHEKRLDGAVKVIMTPP